MSTLQKKGYFAGIFNLHKLVCGRLKNCRLLGSHKISAGVLGNLVWRMDLSIYFPSIFISQPSINFSQFLLDLNIVLYL
jgi:hypothetical protein